MYSRLNDFLPQLKSEDYVIANRMATTFAEGGYNFSNLFRLPGVAYRYVSNTFATHPAPLDIVISRPKPNDNDPHFVARKYYAVSIVDSKKVSPLFSLVPLYYEPHGTVITQYSDERDLHYFCEKWQGKLSYNEIAKLIAQIIFAVQNYHEKGLVHRDITLNNFIIVNVNGNFIIKLTDRDSTIEVDNNGHALTECDYAGGTQGYILPTISDIYQANRHLALDGKVLISYSNVDWKVADCYATGITIGLMLIKLLNKNSVNKICDIVDVNYGKFVFKVTGKNQKRDALASLQLGLINPYFSAETLLANALQSEIFGNTPTAREFFHLQLKNTANYNLEIDGYAFIPFQVHPADPFYLMDIRIKNVFNMAFHTNQMINGFNQMLPLSLDFNHTVAIVNKYKYITNIVAALKATIQTTKDANFNQNFYFSLNNFEGHLQNEMHQMDVNFTRGLVTFLKIAIDKSITEYRETLLKISPTLFGNSAWQPVNDAVALHTQFNYLTNYQEALNLIRHFVNTNQYVISGCFQEIFLRNVSQVFHKPLAEFRYEEADQQVIFQPQRFGV